MNIFRDDLIIRLKYGKDRYLIAEQDEESVSKCRDGSTKNAQWTIEMNDEESLFLKSCYGKYLTASNQPSIPGMIAKHLKVTQTSPEKKNTSHQWLPVSQSPMIQSDPVKQYSIWLKTPHGSYLEAHTGRNLITHDLLRRKGCNPLNKKILWHIEIVESPSDQWRHSGSVISKMLFGMRSFVSEKHKDKEKNECLKDEKETTKERMHTNILSRKLFNSKSC
ncbi:unnamed protein product [Lactuca virosa]|uniref:DUF569 domain-containing protein n=1 Tax=Lactuca virosa TaxID=75947 RepID=A0AAU9NII0_9ASTR|nr:unnamed protein product [Lactuca virosa]